MAGQEIDLRVSTSPSDTASASSCVSLRRAASSASTASVWVMAPSKTSEELIRKPPWHCPRCVDRLDLERPRRSARHSQDQLPQQEHPHDRGTVEYELQGIDRLRSTSRSSFASVLRAHLRQDPDIILVERHATRPRRTTPSRPPHPGHLVFSTLHTNDAAGAFTQLIDMGVEPFLVSSSGTGRLGSALGSSPLPECREPYAERNGASRCWAHEVPGQLYRAKGCEACNYKGYSGQVRYLRVAHG